MYILLHLMHEYENDLVAILCFQLTNINILFSWYGTY